MTWFRVGGAGIPASLKNNMNSVLNKKFGTTGQNYPPKGWPDNVNLLGPLPIIISNKAPIVSFSDGADDVPIESGTFYVVPSQAGTGTPSPSNPRAISGYTGMTISHAKNLFLPNPTDSAASTTNGVTRSYSIDTQEFTLSGTNEKTDANWLIANWSNETIVGLKAGATYTFSHNLSNNCYAQITYYDTNGSTKTLVSLTGNASKNASTQFTVPSDFDRPRNFQIGIYRTATTVDEQAHFMIMGGAVTSDFVKYVTPETLAVSWQTEAGTVYGGERKTDGTLTETWGYHKVTSSETSIDFLAGTNNNGYRIGFDIANAETPKYSGCLSNCFENKACLNSATWTIGAFCIYGTRIYIVCPNDCDTSQKCIDYLLSVNAEFAYPLATPNEYSLSPISLSTYYGANNFYCDTGDSQLNYRADINLYLSLLQGSRSLSASLMRSAGPEEVSEPEENIQNTEEQEGDNDAR